MCVLQVRNEAAEVNRRCELLSKELAASQRELGEVQRMSDVRSRRHEEYIAQTEMGRSELMQKLREEEERCSRCEEALAEGRQQLEVESSARRAAEDSVSTKQVYYSSRQQQA